MIDIVSLRQPEGSVDCGVTVLEMLLHHHGMPMSSDDIKRSIEVQEDGTYAPQLGLYLMSLGFGCEIVMFHPRLFTRDDIGMEESAILERFESIYPALNQEQQHVADFFIAYLKAGGHIRVKIPGPEDVKEEIENGRPVIADLTTNFLLGEQPGFNLHFNLVTAIDDSTISVNDPLWDARGGKHTYPLKDWFFGLYASTYAGFHEGVLLKVRRGE